MKNCSNGITNNKSPIGKYVSSRSRKGVKDENKQKDKEKGMPIFNVKKCTSGGSSISSIPGLDWDSQVQKI